MALKIDISDDDILTAVVFLKLVFGGDRKVAALLKKIDTPSEVAKFRQPIQDVVDLIASL